MAEDCTHYGTSCRLERVLDAAQAAATALGQGLPLQVVLETMAKTATLVALRLQGEHPEEAEQLLEELRRGDAGPQATDAIVAIMARASGRVLPHPPGSTLAFRIPRGDPRRN